MKTYYKYFNPITIIISIVLFLLVVVLQNLPINNSASMFINPMFEEAVRYLVLLFGGIVYCITYTLTFAIYEFCHYINSYIVNHTISFTAITIRTICIIIHIFYAFIQISSIGYYQKTKKLRYVFLGLIAAYLAHFTWNSIGYVNYILIR